MTSTLQGWGGKMLVLAATLQVSSLAWAKAPGASCETLKDLRLPQTTITQAILVVAGGFTPPAGPPVSPMIVPYSALPAFCRVTGSIRPSTDSNIQFEVWMPSAEWNGKLQGIGNGGFAGAIPYPSLAVALARGYAGAATDTGHGTIDASWALGHPEKVIDFGYRAIHETAVKAKEIIRALYGKGPRRAYFSSCSNGGRQALMEAQRFPEDYDGIIAGAPANNWTHHFSGFAWNAQALNKPGSYLPVSKLKIIEAAALAACDGRDGVADGVIDDPVKCTFDPSTLLCKGPESDGCLTAPQVAALKKIQTGPRNSKGEQIFPGYPPGGETGPGGWGFWILGARPDQSAQFWFGRQFFANMVLENASWDIKTFKLDEDAAAADQKAAKILNSTDPNLKAFKDRGGKLILYHGWSDAAIAPQNTIDYYESVVARMGQRNARKFVRLFMVPGLQHCTDGPGTYSFGQWGTVAKADPEHDISLALERWVEKGTAPEVIIAVKPVADFDPSKGAVRTRPLCPYPLVARWRGSGSTDDAANFVCAKPD